MKKALTILLWLGLAVMLISVISLSGQNGELQREQKAALRKNEVLKSLYDQDKQEWTDTADSLKAERDALKQEKMALNLEVAALTEALNQAQEEIKTRTDAQQQAADALSQVQNEWEAQRQSLNAEREAASGQLSDVLAMLLTPIPERNGPADAPAQAPDAHKTPVPPARDAAFDVDFLLE